MTPAAVEWVDAKTRLPESQRMVLLWIVNGHRGPCDWGFLDSADRKFKIMVMGGWSEVQGDDGYGRITHWAYPPEGPTPRYMPEPHQQECGK